MTGVQYIYINYGEEQQQNNNNYHIYVYDIINNAYDNGISDTYVQSIYMNEGGAHRQDNNNSCI